MPRNLREKIHAILNDGSDLRPESTVTRIENLVKDELELRNEERSLTYQDLSMIQSFAAREFTSMRMDEQVLGKMSGDQPMIRTLCLVNATVSFLRSKGLLHSTFRYKK